MPRWLPAPSTLAWVDYFRCDACGHVFNVSKDGRNTVTDVSRHLGNEVPDTGSFDR